MATNSIIIDDIQRHNHNQLTGMPHVMQHFYLIQY